MKNILLLRKGRGGSRTTQLFSIYKGARDAGERGITPRFGGTAFIRKLGWLAVVVAFIVFMLALLGHACAGTQAAGFAKKNRDTAGITIGILPAKNNCDTPSKGKLTKKWRLGTVLFFGIPEHNTDMHCSDLHTHSSEDHFNSATAKSLLRFIVMACVAVAMVVCMVAL